MSTSASPLVTGTMDDVEELLAVSLQAVADMGVEATVRTGLAGAATGLRRLRHLRDRDRHPGLAADPPVRRQAYDEAVTALVETRITLAVLLTGPPGVLGALWTWPVHHGLLRRFPDTVVRLEGAFLRVETVGTPNVIRATEDAVSVVVDAVAAFPLGGRRSNRAGRAECARQLGLLAEATVDLVVAARADLGHGPRRTGGVDEDASD